MIEPERHADRERLPRPEQRPRRLRRVGWIVLAAIVAILIAWAILQGF